MPTILPPVIEKSAAAPRGPFGLIEAHPLAREQRVRERAFAIYEGRVRTGAPGSSESDWLRAEAELAEPAPGSGQGSPRAATRPRGNVLSPTRRSS